MYLEYFIKFCNLKTTSPVLMKIRRIYIYIYIYLKPREGVESMIACSVANFHIPGLLESSLSCVDGYPNAGLSRSLCRFM